MSGLKMPVKLVSRRQFLTLPETLCLSCARSWPAKCWYWRLKDPESGLELMDASAVKTEVRKADRTDRETLYKVVECPYFVEAKGAVVL